MTGGDHGYPGREPRPDAEATEAFGEVVEELGKIRRTGVWSSRGPHLSMDTVEFMATYASRRRLGRLEVSGNQEHVEALVAADLMGTNGAWNDAGLFITDGFRQTRLSIEVDAGHGQTRSRLDVKVGNLSALAMAGPEVHDVVSGISMSTSHRQLDVVRVDGVPGLIAQWVGLGPAWTIGGPIVMDAADFSELLRVGGPTGSGLAAPFGFERYWTEPWFEWTVRMAPGLEGVGDSGHGPALGEGIEMRFVNAGRAGHFHYAADGGRIRLEPAPTFSVWMELLGAFQETLTGRPAAPADGQGGPR